MSTDATQIHPGKDWEQAQRVAIARLGIQQGRLLAWGDMISILDAPGTRDERLEDPEIRATIEQALEDIIDRPAHTDRETQFETYGLKPSKKFSRASQPALDVARIEAFRERMEIMERQRWEIKRGMSITVSHWMIEDVEKFKVFLAFAKEKVDFLVGFMGVEQKVHTALKHDIRALGWHPVFDKVKASNDMSKLRMIQHACATEYPQYAAAAGEALEYLNKEYKDNYQELREGAVTSTEIPGAASALLAQSKGLTTSHNKPSKTNRPSLLERINPKSWRRSSKDLSSADPMTAKGRSMSHAPITNTYMTPPASPERSKSVAVPFTSDEHAKIANMVQTGEDDAMSRTATVESATGTSAVPVASMISRHDYWRSPWER